MQAFEDNELPDWNCDLQYFFEIEKKIDALKAIIPPARNVSELQQHYNNITARGRQTIFEKEILWIWGSDMSSLIEHHELTEEDKIIAQKILEHQAGGNKRKIRDSTQKRAKMYKAIKDANPRLSYQAVAMKAQQQLAEQGQEEQITEDDVRNAYRAMDWQWERADKIR